MSRLFLRLGIVGALVSLTVAFAAGFTGAASSRRPDVDARLGKGVNILGSDGMFDPPYGTDFSFSTIPELAGFGFQHVRINARPFAHITGTGALDRRWLATLRTIVDAALASRLKVVIDVHENEACQRDARACVEKLEQTWRSLSQAFQDYDNRVLFEILNEPGGQIGSDLWNRMIADNLKVIRVNNPLRPVIVGPVNGNDFHQLDALRIPESESDILVTVHYYEPFAFTHQGTFWTSLKDKVGIVWGSKDDVDRLRDDFTAIAQWADTNHRRIYLGEFGAYDRGDPRSRSCYFSTVAREAERRGWSWAYWQLTPDFRLLNEKTGEWNTWIVAALIGSRDQIPCAASPINGAASRP